MNLFSSLSDAASGIVDFFSDFVDMVKTSITALQTFYDMLVDFDERIVNMVDNCGSSEFDGLPIIKAIATYHYAVGDVVFYLMYMVILVGCLFTVYRIVVLLFQALMKLVDLVKSCFSSSIFSGLGGFMK
jgi:phage-related minor tail protein